MLKQNGRGFLRQHFRKNKMLKMIIWLEKIRWLKTGPIVQNGGFSTASLNVADILPNHNLGAP